MIRIRSVISGPLRKWFGLAVVLLCGCSQVTTLRTDDKRATVVIKNSPQNAPDRSERFMDRTFGDYEFKVTDESGRNFYGVLPLQFDAGHLVLDILVFPPGYFFNLRGVYPNYEFDAVKGVVRYRGRRNTEWKEHMPTPDETERAKRYFERPSQE